MKFSESNETKINFQQTQKEKNKIKNTINNIYSFKLFDSVAVIFMKPGTKGNFKYISTLINDGQKVADWTIRVYYINGKWNAQVAPHPEVKKSDISININELLEKELKDDEIEILANNHMGTIKCSDGYKIENGINILIRNLKEHKFNIKGDIDKKFTTDTTDSEYKINFSQNTDSETAIVDSLTKYVHILMLLLEKEIDDDEKVHLQEMTRRLLTENDKENLLLLSYKYFSQSERIKLAMNYIL